MNADPNMRSIEQNPDIRYLGRLLGDVIRDAWRRGPVRRIESISARPRSTAIAAWPSGERSIGGLEALTLDDTLAFVRGFMLFSMLANLAEDRQGVAAEPGATLAGRSVEAQRRGRSSGSAVAGLARARR